MISSRIAGLGRLKKAMLIGACAATIGAPAEADSPRIILKCIAPLVPNSDGTDCVRPEAPQKTGDRLTAFSIRTADGRVMGLFRKTGPGTWAGPNLRGSGYVDYTARSDSLTLILYTETPQITTVNVYVDTGEVSSSALPPGTVIYESAY